MKITVMMRGGKIVGAFQGHSSDPASKSGIRATPYPGPGQEFHEVEVPEDAFPIDAPFQDVLKQLEKRLKPLLSKRKKKSK
jgi:hypothetical protein